MSIRKEFFSAKQSEAKLEASQRAFLFILLSSCVIKTYLPPQVAQDKWSRNSNENIRMWKTVSMEN